MKPPTSPSIAAKSDVRSATRDDDPNEPLRNPDRAPSPPWGHFRPTVRVRGSHLAARLGLGHGRGKKLLSRFAGLGTRPVDLPYQGVRYRLEPSRSAIESKMLFGSGVRDERELALIAEALSESSVFVDVGANIGYYALSIARGQVGQVIAIEPNPEVFARLTTNVAANPKLRPITTVQTALGAQNGVAKLILSPVDLGSSRIGEPDIAEQYVEVPMAPLDDVLCTHGVTKVDAMKIDVEGLEDVVFEPLLQRAPHLLPKLLVIEHTSEKDWRTDLLGELRQYGFNPVARTRANLVLTKA